MKHHSAESLGFAYGNHSADILGFASWNHSADILGFASGAGGFGRNRGGRSTRPYRDFVPSPNG
ncbi:MAG: hypothetical protein AABM42_03615 [Actinomycetota bacterium]